jgi:hypothetical protein
MQLITLFISGALAQNILLTNNQGQRNTVSGTGCFGLGNGPYTGFNTNDNVVGEFFSQSNCQGSIIATGKRNNLWFGPVNAQSIRVSQDKASNPNAPNFYRSYDDWHYNRDSRGGYMHSSDDLSDYYWYDRYF